MLAPILVFLVVYFIAGILINHYARGMTGAEMVPNVGFWKELPFLVKVSIQSNIAEWICLLGKYVGSGYNNQYLRTILSNVGIR